MRLLWTRKNKADPRLASAASVFLSYSSDRKADADQLGELLESADHVVWNYRIMIKPGMDSWPADMLEAVDPSDVIVFLASPASVTSKPCQQELTRGRCCIEAKGVLAMAQSSKSCSPIARG